MKKLIFSILLCLCMVLMLCPVTAFAEDSYCTLTWNFQYGTLIHNGVEQKTSPYVYRANRGDAISLVHVENCSPYEFVGWKEAGSGTVYKPDTIFMMDDSEYTFDAVYQGPPTLATLAITVDGFEVGNTLADCTFSFESTIPGVTFGKDDVEFVDWNKYDDESDQWEGIGSEAFRADARYQLVLFLNDKGLSELPAVTINGKTPESCGLNTGERKIVMVCEFGTPAEPPAPSLVRGDIDLDGEVTVKDATMLQDCLENPESLEKLTSEQYEAADFNGDGAVTESDLTALRSFLNPITINGPDVVCAQQDYEFTVTPADGVTLDEMFDYAPDDRDYSYTGYLTRDEDGIGHGVVPASKYGSADSIELAVYGEAADGMAVSAAKTVQISPEHIYVDGVCGCGAVQQYTVTYDGGEGSDPVTDVKTHGEPLTLRGETFKMDGFVQTGWVDKETDAAYRLGDTYTENADVTLTPVFEKIITLTVPYTTTVALGDVGVPGEKTFTLALIGDSAPDKDKSNVTITGSVTTNGKGSYNGTLTFTGTERTLWVMLSEGAFVQQVNAGEDGWTYDDTVWGVLMEEIPVAYAMGDDAIASGYTAYVVPASIDGNGYYYIDWENLQAADMAFTNTYTAHDYALKHDATHHWDECACKDVQNKELHKYGDWTVTKEATEQEAGEKEHTCTVCGYTEKAEIEKLPATTEPMKPGTDTKPDTKPGKDNPATGDNSHMALWIALLFMSGAGVIGTTVYGKKKRAK